MSRIGKLLIKLNSNISVESTESFLKVSGPRGVLQKKIHKNIKLNINSDSLSITTIDDSLLSLSVWGTTRSIVNNMVVGVDTGFRKELELVGVGYKVFQKNNFINFSLGKSHSIRIAIPSDINVHLPKTNNIIVEGIDKERVGQFVDTIICQKRTEPFKGKGIKFTNVLIKKKEGKKK